jgi:chromosome segregation ATPase
MEDLLHNLKEEKTARKEVEAKLRTAEEDLIEANQERDTAVSRFESLKKKTNADKGRLEEEMEEMKTQFEDKIEAMKRKARKEKQSSDADFTARSEELEAELTEQWSAKLQKAVSQAEARAAKRYEALREDYESLEVQVARLKSGKGAGDEGEIRRLKNKMAELQTELAASESEREALERQSAELQQSLSRRERELSAAVQEAGVALSRAGSESSGKSYSEGVAEGKRLAEAALKANAPAGTGTFSAIPLRHFFSFVLRRLELVYWVRTLD